MKMREGLSAYFVGSEELALSAADGSASRLPSIRNSPSADGFAAQYGPAGSFCCKQVKKIPLTPCGIGMTSSEAFSAAWKTSQTVFDLTGEAPCGMINRMVEYHRDLDSVFAAVADPTRRAILATLARKPATVTEIARPFPVSLNAISKHLMVLERAGLIRRRVVGREHHCSIKIKRLREG